MEEYEVETVPVEEESVCDTSGTVDTGNHSGRTALAVLIGVGIGMAAEAAYKHIAKPLIRKVKARKKREKVVKVPLIEDADDVTETE